jgi:hypothetical protein
MTTKPLFALLLGLVALVAFVTALHTRTRPAGLEPSAGDAHLSSSLTLSEPAPDPAALDLASAPGKSPLPALPTASASAPPDESVPATNKLQRLTDVREGFRVLAAGDPAAAVRAAKQLTDDNERETAMLTLVSEWTRGELSPASQRARQIVVFGLEAGLGMELVKTPELALLWANELTDGPGRAALLRQTAVILAAADPAGALAFSAQVPEKDRSQFFRAVYGGWAANDTAAALQSVDQMADPTEREAALQAIREVAPVGIGTEVRMEDGYPVINRLVPGTPAELSGQLHPGDRIVALGQGDGSFVEARTLSLAEAVQMIRGAPGTPLQLQVISADAAPGAAPRTISIVRDQIRFKK